jgi:hypothetical protein
MMPNWAAQWGTSGISAWRRARAHHTSQTILIESLSFYLCDDHDATGICRHDIVRYRRFNHRDVTLAIAS